MFLIFFNVININIYLFIYFNDNDSYWLRQLIYLSMIDEHIIPIEFGSNSFNANCDFNTKAHSLWWKVFINWNVRNEWFNDKKKAQGKQ